MNGLLALADGTVFRGTSVGASGLATGEVVFNTAMTGYQEIATDPSYADQVVVMTAPHIGNYGVASFDDQAAQPHLKGLIVRSLARRPSNWRAEADLASWLQGHGVVALSNVDTRRLTRHVRTHGALPAAIAADHTAAEVRAAAAAAPLMDGKDLTALVTTREPYRIEAETARRGRIVAIDLGVKRDILRAWSRRGFDVDVVPADTGAADVLALRPDGVFLSNGPGDPEPLHGTIAAVRELLGRIPVVGICLGHQVLALALGARSFKLPFGHHGGNHPVRRLRDGKVEITAQNHGFAIDLWGLSSTRPPEAGDGVPGRERLPERVMTELGRVDPTHQNLNDGTLEGLACLDVGAASVQYHPEAAPGPRDADHVFDDFVAVLERFHG
jgi:carbamoyl-phosphate synthase small subunit